MWNSYIDKEIIEKVKKVYSENKDWFYLVSADFLSYEGYTIIDSLQPSFKIVFLNDLSGIQIVFLRQFYSILSAPIHLANCQRSDDLTKGRSAQQAEYH